MSKKDEKPFTKAEAAEAPLQQFSSHSLAAPRFGRLARPATLQSQKASPLNSKSTILTPDSPLREVPWICLSSGLHRMQQERKPSVIVLQSSTFRFFSWPLLWTGAARVRRTLRTPTAPVGFLLAMARTPAIDQQTAVLPWKIQFTNLGSPFLGWLGTCKSRWGVVLHCSTSFQCVATKQQGSRIRTAFDTHAHSSWQRCQVTANKPLLSVRSTKPLEGVNIVTMTSSVRECSVIYHMTQYKQIPAYSSSVRSWKSNLRLFINHRVEEHLCAFSAGRHLILLSSAS